MFCPQGVREDDLNFHSWVTSSLSYPWSSWSSWRQVLLWKRPMNPMQLEYLGTQGAYAQRAMRIQLDHQIARPVWFLIAAYRHITIDVLKTWQISTAAWKTCHSSLLGLAMVLQKVLRRGTWGGVFFWASGSTQGCDFWSQNDHVSLPDLSNEKIKLRVARSCIQNPLVTVVIISVSTATHCFLSSRHLPRTSMSGLTTKRTELVFSWMALWCTWTHTAQASTSRWPKSVSLKRGDSELFLQKI